MYNTEASTIGFIAILNAYEPIIIIVILLLVLLCAIYLGAIKNECKMQTTLLNETNKILTSNNKMQYEEYELKLKEKNQKNENQ